MDREQSSQSLPQAAFSTGEISSQDRYDAWRDLISAVFEPALPEGRLLIDLQADVVCTHLGQAMVIEAKSDAQYFTRSSMLINKWMLDHYIFQIYRDGACHGVYGDTVISTDPGDVKIIDLTQTFRSFNTDFANISLVLPRAKLAPLLERPDALHGMVLRRDTAIGRVVAAHVRELAAVASGLTVEDGPVLAAASARMLGACLGAHPRRKDELRGARQGMMARAIRDFIEAHLASPDLGPDTLTRRFQISRAQLYRLFEEHDGIAAYIQARRLRRCLLAITDPAQGHRRIGDIAHEMGFGSDSHFSHAFRRAYGISPRAARAGQAPAEPSDRPSFINEWMRDLRRPPE